MNDSSENNPDDKPPVEITRELFLEWRSPRFGRSNPERMNNPVWEWLTKSKQNAYLANEKFHGASPFKAGPGWCFDRFGQSSTELSDGRIVMIAGEHEDHYDPDFYIYNDVVVQHPDGKIEIFGYPKDIFPPTDFHTATLVNNQIVIVGSLGYPENRKPGTIPVVILNLKDFAVSLVSASGVSPGWLHRHTANLSDDRSSIVIRGGKLDRGEKDGTLVENIDDWLLHLGDWHWERLTERQWQRWEIMRRDRKPNRLWEVQQALWHRAVRWEKEFREQVEQLKQEYGCEPNLDIAPTLYRPNITHEPMPDVEGEFRIFRIKVEGVTIRYVEDMHSIQMTVEGNLPQTSIDALLADLQKKMTALENAPYEIRRL